MYDFALISIRPNTRFLLFKIVFRLIVLIEWIIKRGTLILRTLSFANVDGKQLFQHGRIVSSYDGLLFVAAKDKVPLLVLVSDS